MPPDNVPNTPRSVDRAALERVLARAAELQVASSDRADVTSELTEAEIVDLGKEVGLSQEHLRIALAEERTRGTSLATDRGIGAALVGVGRIRASRVIAGVAAATLSTIDGWMQREECLQVKRHFDDRMVWESRRDLFGSLRRTLNIGGRGYDLARAHEVAGTVAAIDDSRVIVTLEADLSSSRARLARAVTGLSLSGIAATLALGVMSVMIPVAIVPAVVVPIASILAARQFQHAAIQRAQLALEQLLDRLERGETVQPQSILGSLAAAAAALPRRS